MDSDGDEPDAQADRELRLPRAQERRQPLPAGRGPGRPVRAREEDASCSPACPADYIQISSGLGEAPPLNIIVLPVLFEGEVKAVIELASFQPFSAIHQIFLDQLMESIGVVLNMIIANMRTEELLQQSQGLTQELQSQSQGAHAAAGRAQAHQLRAGGAGARAGGEGAAARGAEQQGRGQEPRGRAGPRVARGEGRAARAHLQVQVRVPRQHVARAAHAAQQPADPRQAALRQQGRQPHRQAGRVRADHLRRRAATCSR